jgi:hypothetical protein
MCALSDLQIASRGREMRRLAAVEKIGLSNVFL